MQERISGMEKSLEGGKNKKLKTNVALIKIQRKKTGKIIVHERVHKLFQLVVQFFYCTKERIMEESLETKLEELQTVISINYSS